ncbi:unnamed protein product [marine sediment metagenome]|uniref:MvaI/BcnI restriction endonuclease domain-containing protein n=1 Tax=marine sediment metagenome TaxID=412755 RepID=X1C0Z0_9ZZZZ
MYNIVGKFLTKTERLILVTADVEIGEDEKEKFHYNEAYLLENPMAENFLNAFGERKIVIDIRMHLKPSGGVRNHGTGIRVHEHNLPSLYSSKKNLF